MKRVPYVGQVQETECGLCCAAMILKYYGTDASVKTLTKIVETGRDGVTFMGIKEIFEYYNYSVSLYEASPNNVKKVFQEPMILFWNNNHFVVLEKIKGDTYYIVDPNMGKRKVDYKEFSEKYSNFLLKVNVTKDSIKIKEKNNPWKIYKDFFKKNIFVSAKISLIALVTYLTILAIPFIIQNIVNILIQDSNILKNKNYLILAFSLMLLFVLINLLKNKLIILFSAKMDEDIYVRVINKLFSVPYKFFLTRSSSDLLYRLNLIKTNREFFIEQIIQSVFNLGSIFLILGIISYKSIVLLIYILVITTIMSIIIMFINYKVVMKSKEEIIEGTKLQGKEYEAMSSMFTLKATGIGKYTKELLIKQYYKSLEKFKERSSINAIYGTVLDTLTRFAPLLILIISITFNYNNSMSVGELILIYTLINYYFSNLSSIYTSVTIYGTLKNNLERLQDILEQEEQGASDVAIKIDKIEKIEFKNVFFKYPGQKDFVLKDINLTINANKKYAIVGATGSGKSTIIGLIFGLYKPTQGKILVNGYDLDEIDLDNLKDHIGFVPQEAMIFNTSIKENILMNRDFEDIYIVKAAKRARIHDEVMKMPMAYETLVSELGNNISGGQKQRIILTRAIVSDPNLVILDEATSSVDNITESLISEYFEENKNTQIIIAHRLSTIIKADCIYVLDKGSIIESGNHNKLLKNRNVYWELYRKEEDNKSYAI